MPRPAVRPRTAAKYQTSWKNSGGYSSAPWKEWRFGIKPGARGKKYYTVQDVTIGDLTLNMKAVYNVTQKDALFFATGLRLWPSARILSMYLAAHPEVLTSAEMILELGSGSGLVGIAASKLCGQPSKVVMTDHDDNVLELLQENIDSNFEEGEGRPTCEFLDWCTGVERFKKRYGTFDVVLGADIVYSERTIMPMLNTAKALLTEKPSSVFLLVYVGRLKIYDEMFREGSTQCQLHCTEVKLDSIPGAADIQDDSAMLHKIRIIVLRHKEFLDKSSLDLLVAETLERVRTLQVEDTVDCKAAEIKNPGLNDVMAEESTEYDRLPIADHRSDTQSSRELRKPKESSGTRDERDERPTIIDETAGSSSDCKVIVPLKHIATEALVAAAEEGIPAEPNGNVMEDNGEVVHNFGADNDGGNSQDESSAKKDYDLSGLPATDEGGEAPTMAAPACHHTAGRDIPADDREMKSQTKEDIPVIPTVMAVSEAEEKPLIVNGALTADELPSIQVTSTEDVVDVETDRTVVGYVEGSDRVNVDDLTPKPEEPSQINRVVGSGLEVSPESASNSVDTIEAAIVADRLNDVPNEAELAVNICTSQPPVSVTETAHCEERDRIDSKFDQEVESTCMTTSENGRQSDDITVTKSQPLDEELSGIESEASLFRASEPLESTQNGDRKLMKYFDKDMGSIQSCSVSEGDDEIIYYVNNSKKETRFDADKKEPVDNIVEEQPQAVPDDGVEQRDERSTIKRTEIQNTSAEVDSLSHESQESLGSFETDSVTSNSTDEDIDDSIDEIVDSRADGTKTIFTDEGGELDDISTSEGKTKIKSGEKYSSTSDSHMSLCSAMMYLVLIPAFVSVVMFLVSLSASVWLQIFFKT